MYSVEDGRVSIFLLFPLIPVILHQNQKGKLVHRLDLHPIKGDRRFPQEVVETKHRAKTD